MQLTNQYNRIAVALHWLMAVMISLSLFAGNVLLEPMDNSDPEKLGALQGHAIFGAIIGLLLILRYLNIKLRNTPDAANRPRTVMGFLANWAHRVIYVLVLLTVASGIAMAVEGDFASLFSGASAMPESFNHLTTRTAHGILTKLLILVIVSHIVAALYHQFVKKDHLLRRMRWKRFN